MTAVNLVFNHYYKSHIFVLDEKLYRHFTHFSEVAKQNMPFRDRDFFDWRSH